MAANPASLTAEQIEALAAAMVTLRDALPDDIHRARVATRRLRELIPLTGAQHGVSWRQAFDTVRRTGRALGRVRELDSLMLLCDRLGSLYPNAAGELAACRAELADERGRAARRLVKRLERFDVAALRESFPHHHWGPISRAWKQTLRDRLEARAVRVQKALDHATGVYFPNRLHALRIQLKKLRYLAEVATETGIWTPAHLCRDANRLQDALGDIHDRQVLLERLERRADDDSGARAALRADIASRHADFLGQRSRIRGIVEASLQFARNRGHGLTPALWVAGVLVPTAGAALLRMTVRPAKIELSPSAGDSVLTPA